MAEDLKRAVPLNLLVMTIHHLRCIANGSAPVSQAETVADELQAALIKADEAYRATQKEPTNGR